MEESRKQTVRVHCDKCAGGLRNHVVLAEHVESSDDEAMQCCEVTTYQICRCLGCDRIRFREEFEINGVECGVSVYPERKQRRRQIIPELKAIPGIGTIYGETILSYDAGAMILTGAGLRAIVEAICISEDVEGKNLEDKIDALVEKQLLAKPQADLLHEERYIGNYALHEIDPPSEKHLTLGLDIIEGLLNTIHVLPKKARELRAARVARKESGRLSEDE